MVRDRKVPILTYGAQGHSCRSRASRKWWMTRGVTSWRGLEWSGRRELEVAEGSIGLVGIKGMLSLEVLC